MSGAEGKAVKGVDGMSVREESVRCMVELGWLCSHPSLLATSART
jgi:hypothetical protein